MFLELTDDSIPCGTCFVCLENICSMLAYISPLLGSALPDLADRHRGASGGCDRFGDCHAGHVPCHVNRLRRENMAAPPNRRGVD